MGSRTENIDRAIESLEKNKVTIVQKSSWYETEPWGEKDQSHFLNIAIEVSTKLSPTQLLNLTQSIEKSLGKDKKTKWGERVIDIDILMYGDQEMDTEKLMLPHPRMKERNFVLIPLMEIAAEVVFPGEERTIEEAYINCEDACEVILLDNKPKS